MAQALEDLGFSVMLGTNADKKAMYHLIDDFGLDIRGADIALFYYSGHGVQVNGQNYLIPIAAEITIPTDVETESVQLGRVLARMEAGEAGTNIVILDACRDNPFPQATRGMGRGLAVVAEKPPESVIVYSTEAGETADDGNGRNGVFTAALLKNIHRDEEFSVILRDVNAEVRQDTRQAQRPAKYDNLTRAVYLSAGLVPGGSAEKFPGAVASGASSMNGSNGRGSLSILTKASGSLFLDGTSLGDFPAGGALRLDSIPAGERSLELHYGDGLVETEILPVFKGQTTFVSFEGRGKPMVTFRSSAVGAMVYVKGGTFMMGSTSGLADEKPAHQVGLSGFFICPTEVTQAQYKAVMGKLPNNDFRGDKLPVTSVSWIDAVTFCNKLSEKEGLAPVYAIAGTTVTMNQGADGYRLPTEAEWEYAAKGGQVGSGQLVKYSGSDIPSDIAWYDGNSGGAPHPVGGKAPNALGLYDMSGNVWEWCWDFYGKDYYQGSPSDNPMGPATGIYRVSRGGGFSNVPNELRTARRYDFFPSDHGNNQGFRVARHP